MDTFLIKRSEIEKVLTMKDCMEATEDAFRYYGKGKAQMPPKSYLYFEDYFGDLRCMPAYIPELGAAGIKAVNVHPENRHAGLPTVMATILLIDPKTGFPLAVMDGTHITNMRTGAAGGIAIKFLAKEKCKKMAFVGAGNQAMTQLAAAMLARPKISEVSVFDLDKNKAASFAKLCKEEYNLEATAADSIHTACSGADIINTTTSSRKPIVMLKDVAKGAHINAIGADAKGKQEIDPEVLKVAKVVIDDWEQASHSGEINVPIHDGKFSQKDIAGEMGKVVAKHMQIRKSDDDITLFDSTGLAIQDLTTAWHVYQTMTKGYQESLQPFGLFN
ncbi:MAG TPA: ornithine cyclodeaminase family protein [candidate division Zixibacteria bacterium]|nr:ornithine cyclodeaminase family protein [candidate division Zixibacteria bacterium]